MTPTVVFLFALLLGAVAGLLFALAANNRAALRAQRRRRPCRFAASHGFEYDEKCPGCISGKPYQ